MQKKLPLDNTFLRTITCIDPLLVVSPSETQLKRMLKLRKFLSMFLVVDEDENEIYEEQLHALLSIDALCCIGKEK